MQFAKWLNKLLGSDSLRRTNKYLMIPNKLKVGIRRYSLRFLFTPCFHDKHPQLHASKSDRTDRTLKIFNCHFFFVHVVTLTLQNKWSLRVRCKTYRYTQVSLRTNIR